MKPLSLLFGLLVMLTACTPDSGGTDEPNPPTAVEDTRDDPEIRDIPLDEAKQLVESSKDLVILDVRTPQEFADGHLPGARNVDYLVDETEFRKALDDIDRTAPVLMHCQSGGRSAHVVEIMTEMGFEDVSHLKDGFAGWQEAGFPVEK